ncbi:acVLRF1 family peptidyl-tRNA hydrolase [Arthrobacter sp. FX8]|uniref:acVLRF1 family peptidyl-tRNA hydrolase n=1 Tax=Arthrobacter sp. FX8 TaxID=2997335 RepID=UPI00227BF080|nr:acVLRF1 family peptidyl-tRNA hydrolase [Arthrobacter sp. FX8]WAJ34726.1 acVLRF1 family peptidyl-tRNA hydrolase [Arthrobacter sp. FX8]
MPATVAHDGPPSVRTAFVPGSRLPGWADRFGASHGGYRLQDDDDGLRLVAADGTEALLQAPWPADGRPGRGSGALERLAALAAQPRRLGLLLVRRGGYGIGVASEGILLASKAGTRYVQSRTAAGGQSQQRFARRRSNQADALVAAVAGQAADVFRSAAFEYLVPGGDRPLADLVLQEPALRDYARLPRLAWLDVAEPRAAVLKKAAVDACSVRITVTDASG